VHQLQRTIDSRGFLIDESYFDTTGAPTQANEIGVHERRYTYDDRGNQLSESYFDVDGKPINQKLLGYARVVYKYDGKNRVIEKAYFGDDGAPQILLNLGAAVIRQEYDEQGNLVRREFLDGQGHPSPHVQYGVPAIRIRVEGDTTIVSLRDGKDRPAKNPINGYYEFRYKTSTDHPLSLTNDYFDQHGHRMSLLRVRVINPHLHALKTTPRMQRSARLGVGAAGLGALLGCLLALIKSSHTKRRKVYVPSPLVRFLGWLSVFCILEGSLRFFMTIYWAWVRYQNGEMGSGVYILETIFIIFFTYRLLRLNVTMRVLNIRREDIHGLIRDFFAKANLKPEWNEMQKAYLTPPFGVRVRFFDHKFHAYLSFLRQQVYSPVVAVFCLVMVLWIACFGHTGLRFVIPTAIVLVITYVFMTHGDRARYREGRKLSQDLSRYIRTHVREIQAPVRTRAIALYYPSVALCYFLLACLAFYTLWQMLKGY
jgi:YD repeat-containing protein